MLQPGDVFSGDYEIRAKLGSGGYATVYHALQRSQGRDVALKLLDLEGETAQQRFNLEARLLRRISDPAIVELLDHGEHAGQHFLVLEFIEGRTLRETIDREGALGAHRSVAILRQIARAVAKAHATGALHRDLKPDNVMLTDEESSVKVLDFGIAKILGDRAMFSTVMPMTEIGKTVGTPRYMSPEALCGEAPTPATDVYSMGMLAFEMLVGERAFPQLQENALIRRIVDHEPILIPDDAYVPEELHALIAAMLAKDLEHRIGSAMSVLERIDELPEYPVKTRVMMPDEFAGVHREARAMAPSKSTRTSEEVRVAAARLRADAEARLQPARLVITTPVTDDAEPTTEQEARPRTRHADVSVLDDAAPELDRPPPRRRSLNLDWRQVAGFGALALALLLAAGYLGGVVGVRVSIVDGHPLECGFGQRSVHIERHFVVFGAELVRIDQEVRCSR